MKILLLTQTVENSLIQFIKDNNDSELLDIKEFTDEFYLERYDRVFVYPGEFDGTVTNAKIKKTIPRNLYLLVRQNKATVLIEHHYSAEYSGLTLSHRVISRALVFNAYPALKMISTYPVYINSDLDSVKENFLLGVRNQAVCFVAFTEPSKEIYKAIPVIPAQKGIDSNIDMQTFFNSDFVTIEQLQEIGHTYWRLQYYYIWGNFNDTIRRQER